MKYILAILVIVVVVLVGIFAMKKVPSIPSQMLDGPVVVPVPEKENIPSSKASAVTPSVKEFTIEGKNFSFSPALITVKKGDKVKIIFKNTAGFHDFKIDAYGVATRQDKAPFEESLEFIADKVGTFEYYCSVGTHRTMGMKGVLKVE